MTDGAKPTESRDLLTVEECCTLGKAKSSATYLAIKGGHLPAVRIDGRVYVPRPDAERWAQQREDARRGVTTKFLADKTGLPRQRVNHILLRAGATRNKLDMDRRVPPSEVLRIFNREPDDLCPVMRGPAAGKRLGWTSDKVRDRVENGKLAGYRSGTWYYVYEDAIAAEETKAREEAAWRKRVGRCERVAVLAQLLGVYPETVERAHERFPLAEVYQREDVGFARALVSERCVGPWLVKQQKAQAEAEIIPADAVPATVDFAFDTFEPLLPLRAAASQVLECDVEPILKLRSAIWAGQLPVLRVGGEWRLQPRAWHEYAEREGLPLRDAPAAAKPPAAEAQAARILASPDREVTLRVLATEIGVSYRTVLTWRKALRKGPSAKDCPDFVRNVPTALRSSGLVFRLHPAVKALKAQGWIS